MKAYARLLLLAFCAFLIAPAQAGDAEFDMKFAGTVYTVLDATPPDTVIITEANARGSFGAQHMLVVSKFVVPEAAASSADLSCDATEIPMVMDYARSVTTFNKLDQMFVFWDEGLICATPGPAGMASYRGLVSGTIVGGTGRFEGAGGSVVSDFGGYDLAGPFVFEGPLFPIIGSFTGTVSGTVEFPE
jgi:hypothetical protein